MQPRQFIHFSAPLVAPPRDSSISSHVTGYVVQPSYSWLAVLTCSRDSLFISPLLWSLRQGTVRFSSRVIGSYVRCTNLFIRSRSYSRERQFIQFSSPLAVLSVVSVDNPRGPQGFFFFSPLVATPSDGSILSCAIGTYVVLTYLFVVSRTHVQPQQFVHFSALLAVPYPLTTHVHHRGFV